MCYTGRLVWIAVFMLMLTFGSVGIVFGAEPPARTINLPDQGAQLVDDNDDEPDVTSRVARISFIRGDVQIRRTGGTDWENATLNLPIVEGDELSTSNGARIEIQFNNFSHLRVDENASLKIAVLRPEGIAISLLLGTISLRVTDLERSAGYIEVDAPKTTVALQRDGTYRIDAGKAGDLDIRFGVTNGGEARVYSDTAGFTLKSGRGARVFIDGSNAGEWETADAAQGSDEFDAWAGARDAEIAKRIKDAYYDKYYDQDIYGADDLDGYGEWIHTPQFGYVWRPYKSAVGSYADWTPYRYGHWRWVPPYGWTWVNDEPWGWATYHYGRWVFDNGYWVWSPYGYYRAPHTWWFPALVVINIVNDNVCWYPLQYHRRYTSFNHHRDRDQAGGRPGTGPRPSRSPGTERMAKAPSMAGDPSGDRVPPNGVISVGARDFGTRTRGYRTAPPVIAGEIISKVRSEDQQLPDYGEVNRRITRDIVADKPKASDTTRRTKVGAADRRPDAPLDRTLRETRIFGGRPQVKPDIGSGSFTPGNGGPRDARKAGAVERPMPKPIEDGAAGITNRPPGRTDRDAKPKGDVQSAPPAGYQSAPSDLRPPKPADPRPTEVTAPQEPRPARQPKNEPPQREEKPRTETPPAKQPPRSEPPQREVKPPTESPKSQPKTEAPKSQPKIDPPPKIDRAEQKNRKDTIN